MRTDQQKTYASVLTELGKQAQTVSKAIDAAAAAVGKPDAADGVQKVVAEAQALAKGVVDFVALKPEVKISPAIDTAEPYLWIADGIYFVLLGIITWVAPTANSWFVTRFGPLCTNADRWWCSPATGTAILTDLFLLYLLFVVILRSRTSGGFAYNATPTKLGALGVLGACAGLLVLSFSQINSDFSLLDSTHDKRPTLEAFFTVTSFEHGHFKDELDARAEKAIVLEHVSTLLLLVVFFPLLIGRLAMFAKEGESPRKFEASLSSDTSVTWVLIGDENGKAPATSADPAKKKILRSITKPESMFKMDGDIPDLVEE